MDGIGVCARRWRVAWLCALVTSASPVLADEVPSFRKTIQPMLDTYCVSCHLQGSAPEDLVLQRGSAYRQLVGIASVQSTLKRVVPGDPQASYLLHKLTGDQLSVGGKGVAMPFGQAQADTQLIQAVQAWIASGAPNN
ncbi:MULTISPECIES: hypothetical protein [unclassified Pseudomonas]|jgi:hypothetical protein|uniref:hypothetical protein n=1 Tax=unclassified Pseudomonas TaxID=196821 RepID=UPI001E2FBEE4|nr:MULTISPECIES: hypothetical protein [unclassified Pseudomonas]MDC0687732.1 hypothetical protein [Mitsuaria sp. RG]MCE0917373.1 hypothetical protein [Pseudomonas sp. NMI760_13]MCF1488012.1 hypothetical protein [Pseudomonas sp. AA27]MCP8635159.1 hypothetical protein [Pseudomonas sp. DVZ6]MDD7785882.1 hypothetical protein [Pseudomonas sp. DVZ24]